MIGATDLKNGKTFLLDGSPYKVVKYSHQKIARGAGTIKLSVKNLATGGAEEKTLGSNTKVEEITTLKKPLQFLYTDAQSATFMDPQSYEQIEIPIGLVKGELPFIKEGNTVDVLFWEERPLSVDIPPKATLKVAQTDPGVKGNSASNIYKPAELENGMTIKVPLFIKTGDKIRIDTRTGEYVERVS